MCVLRKSFRRWSGFPTLCKVVELTKKRFILIFLIVFCLPLFSQENSGDGEPAAPAAETEINEENLSISTETVDENFESGGIGARPVVSMIFGLLLIALLFFFLFRYFKRLTKPTVSPEGGFFRVLASESLFGSRYIHIVKAGSSYYFLASADNEVTLLEKIEDPEMIQSIELYVSSIPTEPQTFQERLMSAVQKSKIRVSMDETARKMGERLKKQGDKFKKM